MNEQLTKQLIEKYPKIFPKDFGFEHNDGWYWLVNQLCNYLQFETKFNNMPQIQAVQVKEKFGLLRFYYTRTDSMQRTGRDERAIGAIRLAEHMSGSICEHCGVLGAKTQEINCWMTTICRNCTLKQVYNHLANNMEDLDPEIAASVNKNFWSLIGEDDTEYEQLELFNNDKDK